MTGSVTKRKGANRYFKRNVNEKINNSTAAASALVKLRKVHNVTNLPCDSDESDYEDNLPLIYVKEGMKDISQGESPIGCRTRKRLHEKNLVLCEKQREMCEG